VAKKSTPSKLPDSYELLGMRLQRAINSSAAQRAKSALLQRLPDDRAEDWDQIMEELGDTDNVTLAYRDDGHVQVFWTVPKED
jgi:hypothetical protein